jgi:hypothetical protein
LSFKAPLREFFSPSVACLKREFSENQSQKFALPGSEGLSALLSAELSAQPLGRKWRQCLHERRSFPQSAHIRDLPRGSGSVIGEPQYQHIAHHTIIAFTTQYEKNLL